MAIIGMRNVKIRILRKELLNILIIFLQMTDKNFIELLETVRKELHKRMGKEMCKELHSDCIDCKTRYIIGLINGWVDILEN